MKTEFKVGLFSIVGIIITGYLFFVLNPSAFKGVKQKEYYTYLDNAAGIFDKTQVKTNGVTIGKVIKVILDTNKTKVVISVDAFVKIPEGSTIEVKSIGFLGDSHLAIHRAEDNGVYLENGDYIPKSERGTSLNALLEHANVMVEDIAQVTKNLSSSLGGEQGAETIKEAIDNVSSILKNLNGILTDNRQNVKDLIAATKQTVESLKQVLAEDNQQKLNNIIEALEETTRSIKLVAGKIEKGEGSLGRLVNNDEAAVELEKALKDIREVIAPAVKTTITVSTHVESTMNLTDRHTSAFFNLKLQTRPDWFYLLGFTSNSKSEKEETITTHEEGDEKVVKTIKEENGALKFNVMFGKRWQHIALRLGLIQSEGGVGMDLYALRDRLSLSLDMFDFKGSESNIRKFAYIKVYLKMLLLNHIQLIAGIDDPTHYKSEDSKDFRKLIWFGGLGLEFDDNDIKSLLGFGSLALK